MAGPHSFPSAAQAPSSAHASFPQSCRHRGVHRVSWTAASRLGFRMRSVSPIPSTHTVYIQTPSPSSSFFSYLSTGLEGLPSAPALRLMSQVCDSGSLLDPSSSVQRPRRSSAPCSWNSPQVLVISPGPRARTLTFALTPHICASPSATPLLPTFLSSLSFPCLWPDASSPFRQSSSLLRRKPGGLW